MKHSYVLCCQKEIEVAGSGADSPAFCSVKSSPSAPPDFYSHLDANQAAFGSQFISLYCRRSHLGVRLLPGFSAARGSSLGRKNSVLEEWQGC